MAVMAINEPDEDDLVLKTWRQGRKLGRTIYAQAGGEPSDEDELIGLMDTEALAEEACEAHNKCLTGSYE
jgi:hypothetical protein